MTSVYEETFLKAAFEVLEDYLQSETLYWPLGLQQRRNEPPYPQLTPGNVLLFLRRLQAVGSAVAYERQLEAVKARWGAHWAQKAAREAKSRLRQWRDYLSEAGERFPYYHYKVRERVILALLEEDQNGLPSDVAAALTQLDGVLRAIFVPGGFIWEAPLQRAFPREPFWYLYGQLAPGT